MVKVLGTVMMIDVGSGWETGRLQDLGWAPAERGEAYKTVADGLLTQCCLFQLTALAKPFEGVWEAEVEAEIRHAKREKMGEGRMRRRGNRSPLGAQGVGGRG